MMPPMVRLYCLVGALETSAPPLSAPSEGMVKDSWVYTFASSSMARMEKGQSCWSILRSLVMYWIITSRLMICSPLLGVHCSAWKARSTTFARRVRLLR